MDNFKNLRDLPYELKLEVLLKLNDFETLQNLCSIKAYYDVCKMNKSKIIAHVFFNKYGKKVFSKEKVLQRFDDLKMVKELIKLGADIRIKNDIVLLKSAEKGHLELVKSLVEKGANINV